jgi:CheY-like chemotaxis protein
VMPGMTGIELAAASRQLRPSLPILLATGYAELPEGTQVDLPRLAKPYHQDQLRDRLDQMLAETEAEPVSRYHSSSIG